MEELVYALFNFRTQRELKPPSLNEVAAVLGLAPSTVYPVLVRLREAGLIKLRPSGGARDWLHQLVMTPEAIRARRYRARKKKKSADNADGAKKVQNATREERSTSPTI